MGISLPNTNQLFLKPYNLRKKYTSKAFKTKKEALNAEREFVIAYKDDIKYAIQCKKYSSPVGIKAVQEVIASKAMNDCHVAAVLTNNTFTKSAKELANKNNVLLWDRDKLQDFIENYNKIDENNKQ